jgi:hypothetical protein
MGAEGRTLDRAAADQAEADCLDRPWLFLITMACVHSGATMSFRKEKPRRNKANQCDIVRFSSDRFQKAAHEKGMSARVNEFEKKSKPNAICLR